MCMVDFGFLDLIREAANQSKFFFSGPATKSGGGKGLATKKKELFL